MLSRREFLQLAAATAAITGGGDWSRAFAQQRMTEAQLLAFQPLGNVSLVHVTDIHAQLVPIYFREPTDFLDVGETGGWRAALLKRLNVPSGSVLGHALQGHNFEALAKAYGRVGGLDRIATVVKSIRAERGDRVLLLDGGDTWQNSYTSLATKGQDMVDCMALLKPDAMTGHWEFTLGEKRVKELVDSLGFPFLGQNIRDNEWDEEVFKASATYERGGVKVAVIGQALPYTPIANPRWMIPKWSFGIREESLQKQVDLARRNGAHLVVLLSHNGLDLDRKLATRVKNIDVILCGHTHDAFPEPIKIGKTLLIASGSHGKYVSRLDLDVQGGEIKGYRYKLIPIFSDAIASDPMMAQAIRTHRQPHETMLREVVGTAKTTLFRRGNFNGSFDDVICDALLAERDAEISLSPGFRWGATLLPGQPVTREDVYNSTAITYPAAYRLPMTGARLKEILEDVADNVFNPDPYLQGGGDMVRIGGISYSIDIRKPIGSRISDLKLVRNGHAVEAGKDYVVAGWASVTEGVEGPAIWDILFSYFKKQKSIAPKGGSKVKVIGL